MFPREAYAAQTSFDSSGLKTLFQRSSKSDFKYENCYSFNVILIDQTSDCNNLLEENVQEER
jgi:hypothetical protein